MIIKRSESTSLLVSELSADCSVAARYIRAECVSTQGASHPRHKEYKLDLQTRYIRKANNYEMLRIVMSGEATFEVRYIDGTAVVNSRYCKNK